MPRLCDHQQRDRGCDHIGEERHHGLRIRRYDESSHNDRNAQRCEGRRRRCKDRVLHRGRREDGPRAEERSHVRIGGFRDHRTFHMRPSPEGRCSGEFQHLQLPQGMPSRTGEDLQHGRDEDPGTHRPRTRGGHHRTGYVPSVCKEVQHAPGRGGIRTAGHPDVSIHALQADQGGQGGSGERIYKARQARRKPQGPQTDGRDVRPRGQGMERFPDHRKIRAGT